MTDLMKGITNEARKLADEAKTLEAIASKNLLSFEAYELLANIKQRLNVLEHMHDQARDNMRAAAAAESAALERPEQPIKKSIRTSSVSPGERAKQRMTKRGVIIVRGV